ncbi:transcriptional regulator [Agromyces rhizosphaerae]|uniref:Transcriptional regulator n=1 Tax=Agromyces rhizosphaerae TaxID=88374 RepID=A0A9W6CZ37_9MICO|nr:TetR/AcrR family transcriptional regulator [Agromyces rhizosphaerae]GLI26498.1 transcriptional regulator [Agromyces rhizosphaerae]
MASDTDAVAVGYAKGRATKDTIVARAAESFAQRGFHGTTLRGIAREAGVDHSTLVHHFGDKTALLLAVLDWYDRMHLTEELPGATEFPEGLPAARLVEGFVDTARRNRDAPGLVRLLSTLSAEAGEPDHPARPYLQERQHQLRDILATTIRAQRAAGVAVDDGTTPEAAAAVIIAAWEGMQVYDALHPGEIDVPALLERELRRAFGVARS